ncbi:uncharacterized protein V1516DRAFT_708962 [Lipomyces oligophaga]|uniref:uncharacterized protein n=1 Tax=Lipomyces oligophaga TaxID=45792 RepID=UPI0034CE8A01
MASSIRHQTMASSAKRQPISLQQGQQQQQLPAYPPSSPAPSQIPSLSQSEDPNNAPMSDSRKRQTRRDEAIRRKNESDLSKKKVVAGKNRTIRRPPPGTVLALRPSPALQIKPNTTVAEAAQLMSAKRENCVLVTDDDDKIAGIFTAKDLAFRVVGTGTDARDVTIEDIMTKNPLCARTDTSATDALDLMVRKGFRHLPVMDENQDISGVLDITKCFHEAMEKLERSYESSRKLFDALEGVQTELGTSQPAQIINYVEALRIKMAGPNLESVLDGNPPTFVNIRTSVRDAARLMRENHTTAVLVTDKNAISGIFTSKDVVLRVIAAGLDPSRCSVVRVMTPHPDFAPKEMSIQAALRKMHDGHYLNLPVMGDDNEIIGMVDVLKLTYATLEQIHSMAVSENEGPAWNKFWSSLDNDAESLHSEHLSSHRAGTPYSDSYLQPPSSPPTTFSPISTMNYPDVVPMDSISHFADESTTTPVTQSVVGRQEDPSVTFKFKAPNGRTHRIQHDPEEGYAALREVIASKLGSEISKVGGLTAPGFAISYLDDDGDAIVVATDEDLTEAINLARQVGTNRVNAFIHHPDKQVEIPSTSASVISSVLTAPVAAVPVEPSPLKREMALESEIEEDTQVKVAPRQYGHPPKPDAAEAIPGVPNELLLPGALVTLAASILVVFTLSRLSK